MTQDEILPVAATPRAADRAAPDVQPLPPVPPLTKASLNALCDAGGISPAAWSEAVDFCGFKPRSAVWLAYWRQLCLIGGALFVVAGVICFIAWNWQAMTPLARMVLTGVVVAGSGLASVLLGPDTRLGRVLLLACGIAVGPMLAVFGQTYQTGAELWELFRVWTVLLVLLALAGRQAGLWFAVWLSVNMLGALWLGRGLASPFDGLGQSVITPEWPFAIACALVCWEWAARRAAARVKQAAEPDDAHAWLCSRWMPRLLYFDMIFRTAFFVHGLMNGLGHNPHFSQLWLPANSVAGFAVCVAGLSWWWYRTRQPDLFMLASLLAAGALVLLSAMEEAGLFHGMGDTAPFLLWGLLVSGITAVLAKIVLYLQRHLQRHMATAPAQGTASAQGPASGMAAYLQHERILAGRDWQKLWAHLQARKLVPQHYPFSDAISLIGGLPSPWYIRAMLAFGGWVSAAFFICFMGFLLFSSLQISSNEELIIFIASLPLLLAGRLLLPRGNLFARHFGFALVIAGTVGVSMALCLSVSPEGLACFALVAVLWVLCLWVRNAGYTGLAAVVVGNSLAVGIAFFYKQIGGGFAGTSGLLLLWWTLVCAGLAWYCLRENAWRGRASGKQADAWFYGLYASALIFQICTLAPYSVAREVGLPGLTAGYLGFGAALAEAVLAFYLSRGAGKATRMLVLAGIPPVFVLSWYLPGVGLALLGLTLARQMCNMVMQGFVLAYLFAYMVFYYYTLAVPFFVKSLYLVATGLGLLAVALVLRLWQAKHAAEEAAHA